MAWAAAATAGACEQLGELLQGRGRELLEGVAVGEHEAADPRGVGVQQELADRPAGVVADERDVVQVEGLEEADDLPSDAAWRLIGALADRQPVGAEREIGGDRADAPGGQGVGHGGPQRGADEHAVDEDNGRGDGVVGSGGAVVDRTVWQRDRRHGRLLGPAHNLHTACW